MRFRIFALLLALAVVAPPLSAQLSLPQVGLPPTGTVLDPVTGQALETVDGLSRRVLRRAERLADLRLQRIDRLLDRHADSIEGDIRGEPARRGEILLIDAGDDAIAGALALGYRSRGAEQIEGSGISVVRLAIPPGITLAAAQAQLARALPDVEIAADNLYFPGGSANAPAALLPITAQAGATRAIRTKVGVIDGGAHAGLELAAQRGFAAGAPRASNHGSSVVSLLQYAGVRHISLADVYGDDRAGGNALAIARAMGWLSQRGCKVINISLVGPPNPLLERAVARARAMGAQVVAPVGNDGPAAPPAYPASYDGVLAITGVDKRNRALIEAGRALHLDYAAPGADIYGLSANGTAVRLRGTSFAAPLVAARLAAALDRGGNWRRRLDAEARDLGRKGPDAVFGRGLVCAQCRPGKNFSQALD